MSIESKPRSLREKKGVGSRGTVRGGGGGGVRGGVRCGVWEGVRGGTRSRVTGGVGVLFGVVCWRWC